MRSAEQIAADIETAATWVTGPRRVKLMELADELRGTTGNTQDGSADPVVPVDGPPALGDNGGAPDPSPFAPGT